MNPTNSQLIHAVVELVIGTCITVWLNRKISTVTQRVVLLENKNKYYENTIVQHHELIKKLFSLLQTMSPETVKITNPSAASASVKNTVPVPVPVPVPEISKITSIPVNPGKSRKIPAGEGEVRQIPVNPGKSQFRGGGVGDVIVYRSS